MNVVHLLNPEGVILGGGVSLAGDLLWKPLRAEIRASECYRPSFDGLPIVPPNLGIDAPLVGAAFLDRFPPRA
jgi:glucokinase